jgi:hypothetical protein
MKILITILLLIFLNSVNALKYQTNGNYYDIGPAYNNKIDLDKITGIDFNTCDNKYYESFYIKCTADKEHTLNDELVNGNIQSCEYFQSMCANISCQIIEEDWSCTSDTVNKYTHVHYDNLHCIGYSFPSDQYKNISECTLSYTLTDSIYFDRVYKAILAINTVFLSLGFIISQISMFKSYEGDDGYYHSHVCCDLDLSKSVVSKITRYGSMIVLIGTAVLNAYLTKWSILITAENTSLRHHQGDWDPYSLVWFILFLICATCIIIGHIIVIMINKLYKSYVNYKKVSKEKAQKLESELKQKAEDEMRKKIEAEIKQKQEIEKNKPVSQSDIQLSVSNPSLYNISPSDPNSMPRGWELGVSVSGHDSRSKIDPPSNV